MIKKSLYFILFVTISILPRTTITSQNQNNTVLVDRLLQLTVNDFQTDEDSIVTNQDNDSLAIAPLFADSLQINLDSIPGLKFYQEPPYMGLKGEIEKIVTVRYAAAYDEKKNPIIKTKSNKQPEILSYSELFFDENGYPKQSIEKKYKDEIEEITRKKMQYDGPQLVEMTEINPKNIEAKTVYVGEVNGYYIYKISRKNWKDVEMKYKYNFNKQEYTLYTIDDLGNKVVDFKRIRNHKPQFSEQLVSDRLNYKCQYKYNNKGLLRRVVEVIVDTKPFVRFYNYTKFDDKGNWLTRIYVYPNGVPLWIERVEYTYK